MSRQTHQNVCASVEGSGNVGIGVESPLPHHQHSFPNRAQEPTCGGTLTGLYWPKPSVNHRMSATFREIHALHLRPSSLPTPGFRATEVGGNLFCVGQVGNMPIQSHQAQSVDKGSRCILGCQGFTDVSKQSHQGAYPQLVTPIGQRAFAWQHLFGAWPEQTQSITDLLQHHPKGEVGEEVAE